MWKKIRESTSGINLNFISSFMRKRRYSKFQTDDDVCKPLNGHLHDEIRDEENNKVTWTTSSCSKRRTDDENDNVFVDTGFRTVELKCSDNNRSRKSTKVLSPLRSEPFKSDYGSTNIEEDDASDSSYSYGNDSLDNCYVTHHEFYEARRNGIMSPSSVKDDVQDFVKSHIQRRYQKLDDSNDESDDIVDYDRNRISNSGRPTPGLRDSGNQVFHSIKDIDPNWEDKPKKSKKRKKAAKRARRAGRVTWKWLRRGFVGYAGQLSSATSFFVISRTGPYSANKYNPRRHR